MRVRPAFAVLLAVFALGCTASRHQVKLEVESSSVVVHVPSSGGRPIEIPEAELWGAFGEAGRKLVAQVDPLAAAELTFGLTEQSGTYLYYARSRRLVLGSLGGGLVELEGSAEQVTRGYLGWCGGTRLGGGDCLRLLTHSKVLTLHGRYVVTLVMAMVNSLEPMLDSLKGLANPNAVAVTLASAAAMYLMLLLLPEPISKFIAVGITVSLIAYLGLDLFWSLIDGWAALTKAVDLAQNFGDLRQAARDFGRVLGPQMGQVLLLLVSRSLGKGLAAKGTSLPRFQEASAQAARLLRVRLGAAVGVRTVALGAGAITISLAAPALAMTASGLPGGEAVASENLRPPHPLPEWKEGQPASGWLRTEKGVWVELKSGASGGPRALPLPGRNNTNFLHVEAHAAQLMRVEGMREATLYVNKVPCAVGPGCANQLPSMLPPGARLRVLGPGGFDRTFVGTPDPAGYP